MDAVHDKHLLIRGSTVGGNVVVHDKRLFITGSSALVIDGLEFRGRRLSPIVAGDRTNVKISNTVFRQCDGGAVVSTGVLEVRTSSFLQNHKSMDSESRGAGIQAYGAVILEYCSFLRNSAPEGGAVAAEGQNVMRHCLFAGNVARLAPAAWLVGGGSVENCTFVGNVCEGLGGAIHVESFPMIRNCVFAGTVNGPAITCEPAPTVECCLLWENDLMGGGFCFVPDSDGNFSADPLFCDPGAGDYRVREGSPCVDGAGSDRLCGPIGAFGIGCTLEPVDPTSWGRIKFRYRPYNLAETSPSGIECSPMWEQPLAETRS